MRRLWRRELHVYNSCGDRHCPQCSGSKRYAFSQRAEALLLEGIVYYQVVSRCRGETVAFGPEQTAGDRQSVLLFQSVLRHQPATHDSWANKTTIRRRSWCCTLGTSKWMPTGTSTHWFPERAVGIPGSPLERRHCHQAGSPSDRGYYRSTPRTCDANFRQRAVASLNRLRDRVS